MAESDRLTATRSAKAAVIIAGFAIVAAGAYVALAIWMASGDVVNFQGVEINVIFSIQRVLNGEPLYVSPAGPPFDVVQYTPLYYAVVTAIARALGVGGNDPASVAQVSRWVAVVMASAVILIYWRILSSAGTPSRWTKIVTVAFVIAATFPWLALARPDSLAIAFSFASIYLLLRSGSGTGFKAGPFAFAVVLALAAIVSKQNSVVPLGLTFLAAAFAGNRRAIGTWIGITVVAGLAAAFYLVVTPFIKENILDGVNNGIDLEWAMLHAYRFVIVWCLPLLVGLVATFAVWRDKPWTRERLLLSSATVIYLVTGSVFSLKWGSAPNYYVEFVFFAGAMICAGWQDLAGTARGLMRPALVAYAIALMVVRFVNQWNTVTEAAAIPTNTFRGWDNIVGHVAGAASPRDRTYLLGLDLGFAARLPDVALIPSPEIADRANKRKLVDYSCFRSLVRDGHVRYLVTVKGWMPKEFLGADLSQFRLVRELDEHWISASSLAVPRPSLPAECT